MKKIVHSRTEYFKPVVLYLDDLEKIFEIIKEVCKKIIISTSEYEIENLNELKELNKESLNYLKINGQEPWLVLEIDFSNLYLYIHEEDAMSRGIFEKVKQILKDRKRKYSWLSKDNFVGSIGTLLLGILIFSIYIGIKQKNLFYISIGILSLLLGFIFTRISLNLGYNEIYLKRRAESKSFWKRKKDEIIIAIISAMIGSVFTILSLMLLKIL